MCYCNGNNLCVIAAEAVTAEADDVRDASGGDGTSMVHLGTNMPLDNGHCAPERPPLARGATTGAIARLSLIAM